MFAYWLIGILNHSSYEAKPIQSIFAFPSERIVFPELNSPVLNKRGSKKYDLKLQLIFRLSICMHKFCMNGLWIKDFVIIFCIFLSNAEYLPLNEVFSLSAFSTDFLDVSLLLQFNCIAYNSFLSIYAMEYLMALMSWFSVNRWTTPSESDAW